MVQTGKLVGKKTKRNKDKNHEKSNFSMCDRWSKERLGFVKVCCILCKIKHSVSFDHGSRHTKSIRESDGFIPEQLKNLFPVDNNIKPDINLQYLGRFWWCSQCKKRSENMIDRPIEILEKEKNMKLSRHMEADNNLVVTAVNINGQNIICEEESQDNEHEVEKITEIISSIISKKKSPI